ncbi:AAA family ATPase [Acidiphilium sp.]|uniref:AAA family ATPase n=1 Tax=Acidiphilium sp. TaxID=527 RepID=UPI00258DA035|nr:AAA family ATPase [Acidiphilium sp.]
MTQAVAVEEVLSAGAIGAIFRGITSEGRTVRIVANRELMPRPPLPGEVWRIGGVIHHHPTYGAQVHAREVSLERPSGRLIVDVMARSASFPGIGRTRAKALWDALGENLYSTVDAGDAVALAPIVGEELAQVVIVGWQVMSIDARMFAWLDRHGLSPRLGRALIDLYGAEVIAKVEENPYRLLALASWAEVDRFALSLGITADDLRRLVAGAEAAVYRRLEDAHTLTAECTLADAAGSLLGGGIKQGEQAVGAAIADKALIRLESGIQGLGPWSMERFIAERAADMLSQSWYPEQLRLNGQMDVRQVLRSSQTGQGLRLNAGQEEAVIMAMTSPLSVLSGGAGVGKTTALRVIHTAAEQMMRPVWQMALCGRAAKRMEEATSRPATTIARFFGHIAAGDLDLSADWLFIVDESSMLDLPTLYRILRHLRPAHGLLLVGDPGQLPPIGFGLTFHALAVSDLIPRVELTEVHRQAASTGIPQAAQAIRDGRLPDFSHSCEEGSGVAFLDVTPDEIEATIINLVTQLGGSADVQIISAVKNGPAGTRTLNNAFHGLVVAPSTSAGFAAGEPVIYTRNDYDLGVRNGSLGTVVSTSDHSLTVTWDDGVTNELVGRALADLEHAYAITCHKAQGSQFPRVIMPVFASKLLDRALVYTAITRAQQQVVLVGDRSACMAAIKSPPSSSRRSTAMAQHLRRCAEAA